MKRRIALTGKYLSFSPRFHTSVLHKCEELKGALFQFRTGQLPEAVLIVPKAKVCSNDVLCEAISEGLLEIERAGGIPASLIEGFYSDLRDYQCSVRLDAGFIEHLDQVAERVNLTKSTMFALCAFIGVDILEKRISKKAKVA